MQAAYSQGAAGYVTRVNYCRCWYFNGDNAGYELGHRRRVR